MSRSKVNIFKLHNPFRIAKSQVKALTGHPGSKSQFFPFRLFVLLFFGCVRTKRIFLLFWRSTRDQNFNSNPFTPIFSVSSDEEEEDESSSSSDGDLGDRTSTSFSFSFTCFGSVLSSARSWPPGAAGVSLNTGRCRLVGEGVGEFRR